MGADIAVRDRHVSVRACSAHANSVVVYHFTPPKLRKDTAENTITANPTGSTSHPEVLRDLALRRSGNRPHGIGANASNDEENIMNTTTHPARCLSTSEEVLALSLIHI